MKTKISRISRCSVAIVLALLMLFGTMTTSFAANTNKSATGGTNWNANIFFRVPDGWNLSTYPNVQAWAVQSSSASSGTKYAFLLGTMSVAGTTSNSRLYHAWVSANHSGWSPEYIAFTANNSNWGTGDFYISTCAHYTKPLAYGATNSSGAYLFSPSNASNNTATNNNTISGSYNGSNRDVLKKNQDYYIYTGGASSAAGGSVAVTAYYVNGSSFNGSGAIASSSITVNSSDSGAHEQYGGAVEGTKTSMVATPADGYNFDGYYDAGTGGNLISSNASYDYYVFGTKSIYARFSLKTYTISYNKGANGSGSVSSTTKTHGTNATLSSSTFTRTGYTQDGWSTTDGGAKAYNLGGSYSTNASTTLYPHWTAKTSALSFNRNGGSGSVATGLTATYGSDMPTYTESAPTKTGYTFAGFYDNTSGGTQYYTSGLASKRKWNKDTTEGTTLYAHWTAKQISLEFALDGGSGTVPSAGTLKATYDSDMPTYDTTSYPIPTKTGYTFAGYYFSTTKYYNADMSSARTWNRTSKTRLTAHWTAKTSALSFNLNGGSGTAATGLTATYDSDMPSYTQSAPTKTGYTFAGFYDDATGGTKYYNADLSSATAWDKDKTTGTTLYAHWTINSYNVKKTETGASGTVTIGSTTLTTSDQSVNYGTNYTITVTAPSGYNVSEISGASGFTGIGTGTATLTGYTLNADLNLEITYVSAGSCAITAKNTNSSGATLENEAMLVGDTLTVYAAGNSFHSSGNFSVSSDDACATVSSATVAKNGTFTVTAVKPGTATITISCSADGASTTFDVNVGTPTINIVSANNADIGGTVLLNANFSNSTTTPTYSWSVTNGTAAASVSSSTLSAGATAGTATIKVRATFNANYYIDVTQNFTVNTPTISVGNNTTLKVGASYTPDPTLTHPSTASGKWTVEYAKKSGTTASTDGSTITGENFGSATTFYAYYKYDGTTKATTEFTVTPATPTATFNAYSSIGIGATATASLTNVANVDNLTRSFAVTAGSDYATVNSSNGTVTGVKPGTATVTVYYKKGTTTILSKTANVTVTAPTVNITSANNADFGGTVLLTASSSGATTTPTYSFSASNSKVSIDGTTLTAGTSSGTVTITVTARYNASYSKTATQTFTVNAPTIASFAYSTSNMSVGETRGVGNMSTTHPSSISGKWSRNFTSSNTAVATVNPSTGVITAVTPGTFTVTVTILYDGVSTGVSSTTGTLTVATPTVSMDAKTVAKGDSVTFSATTANPSELTIAYSLKTAVTGVSIDANTGVVTVASTCAASSATVVATAKNSAGTAVATKEATLTIENPELVVKFDGTEVNENDVKYMTAGGSETLDTSDTNFSDTLYFYSNNPSVAEVDKNTGVITANAKGTAKITVSTNSSKTVASSRKLSGKGKYSTGAVTEQNLTFTVNVAEAETYKYLYFTNGVNWSGVKAYLWGEGNSAGNNGSFPGQSMVKIGKNEENKDVYAIRYTADYNRVIISDASNSNNRVYRTNSNNGDITLTSDYNAIWCNEANKQDKSGWWNCTITRPQITVNNVDNLALGSDATLTATVVNQTTPSKFKWASNDTNKVSVASADTGTTNTNTVTGTNATGTATVTVKAYAEKPTGWNSIVTDGTADDYVAGSADASVTTTADPRTVSWGNLLKATSGGDYSATGASAAGSITVTGGPAASGGTVAHGTSVTFSASANAGYQHVGWKVNNGANEYTTSNKTISITSNTTVYALFDKKYTLTFTSTNGTVTGEGYSSSKLTTWSGATPATLTVTVATGKQIDWEHSTNLAKYYDEPSTTIGTVTLTGKTVASADEIDSNVTIAYKDYEPTVNFNPYKTDDGSTYTAGGGELTAAWTTSGSGSGSGSDGASAPGGDTTYYLHIGKQNAFCTNTAIAFTWDATNSVYYASYNVTDLNSDIPFVINTTSESLGDGNKSSSTQAVHSMNNSTYNPDGLSFNYFYYATYNGFDCFKFGVNSSRTLYFTFASAGSDLIVRSSTNYTPGGSGSGGGSSSSSGTVVSGGTVPYTADVTFTAEAAATVGGETYQFIGWYSTAQPEDEEEALSTTTTYSTSNVTSDVNVYARYKKSLYLTFYNSYIQDETTGEFNFTAAPPRTVKVGMDNDVRATYTYKAGNEQQRGEEHTKNSTSDYYEGNRLLVLVGETVTLEYSTLASSDAISGIFFNNSLRYTTETEPDNLYKQRVKYTGEDPKCWGAEGDDEWDYDYKDTTTLFADANFYDTTEAPYSNIVNSNYNNYIATVNNAEHTVTWVATQSYLNIDIELGTKYQLHINEDKYDGINIANMNDEGYYYAGEAIESVTPDHTNGLKITLDNTTDTSGTYSFTSTTVKWKDKNGNYANAPSSVTVTAYTSGNAVAGQASNIDHWLVYGTMPVSDLYLEIPVAKEYNMKLSNIVVSDNGSSKKTMLTECGSNSTSATDSIGTISGKVDGTAQAALTDDGTYFTYDGNNNAGHVEVYTDGSSSNNRYLNGGVNKNGYNVTAGQTVSYTFEWNTGKDAEYSFVGWFEGKLVDNTDYKFEPDYNKKLSGKESFTFTPTKNTIVMAVATRDVYIGGNFTSDGAYASSTGNTWASGRPLMDFDPTYVNPEDSTKKGRYTYTFDSVTANTEYQFRCYDTASGTATTNLSVWNQWGKGDYANDADDVFYGRHQYADADGKSHGQFVYKNNTNNWSLMDNTASDHDSNKNHAANGYAAPVTVYFYAYDGGMSVAAEYQWSRAYVSEGRGIDVKSVSGNTTTYNTPTASVANKTVNNKDVTVNTNTTSYGHNGKTEKIYECLVKEKNGSIVVTASPNDENLELQAFLVYNIETKTSESVKEFTKSGSGDSATYIGNIPIPNNSKIYVCPIYKFTDAYIRDQHLESHNVFVRADEIDKDDWGGLVSMYSWGTASGYDSGGWPGQLMIPSDDGSSFYAPLTFQKGGLAGVTFTNYTPVNGGDFINFLGKYQDAGVSDVAYSNYTKPSAANNYQYQVFDYREPISIIENLNETNPKIYDSEDMTLTFALKPGNKASGTVGNGSYNASHNFEYLTDSSGKYRVDLNGNKLSTNPTASYYVVCNYTEAYAPGGAKSYDFADGDRDGTSVHNRYSIDWNVYDQNHQLVTNGTMLSASFTDVHKAEMLTHVAKKLIDDGQPVSGKSVMIAYENPKVSSSDNTEAVRYSGQWYADSTNTIIKGNVRVGILSDGAFIPSETNAPGYATATVGFTPNTTIGEKLSTETGCTGNSLAEITKIHASNGDLQYTVSTKDNFEGWYRKTKDGDFEPIGSNYKSQTINPSFNEDITYYAFYSASASYRFGYTARNGSTKYYSVKGKDLSPAELAAGGILDIEDRASDIASKLGGASNIQRIRVFNRDFTYNLSDGDNSKAYTITFNDPGTVSTYDVGVYGADGNLIGTVTSQFGATAVDLYRLEVGSKPANTDAIPRTYGGKEFIGWKQCSSTGVIAEGAPVLSTMPHFGYNVTSDMYIKPVYGTAEEKVAAQPESWSAYIDKNIITQELTSSSEGTLYNDSVIAFRYGQSTNTTLPRDETKICGIVVVSQTDGATDEQKTRFSGITKANLTTYANYFRQNSSVTVGKMNATNFGEAYAFHIKANSLSDLNRVDLCQVVDYAKFHDGNYKVMAYYYDGTNCICSDLKSGTYTVPNLGS